MILLHWSFPIRTLPLSKGLKFSSHSLPGVMWKMHSESIIHSSLGLYLEIVKPSPLSYPSKLLAISILSIRPSKPFLLFGQCFLRWLSFLQSQQVLVLGLPLWSRVAFPSKLVPPIKFASYLQGFPRSGFLICLYLKIILRLLGHLLGWGILCHILWQSLDPYETLAGNSRE